MINVAPRRPHYKVRPYISSFRFVVFKKPYKLILHRDPPPSPAGTAQPDWDRLELPHAVVYLARAKKDISTGEFLLVLNLRPALFPAIQKAAKLCTTPKEAAKLQAAIDARHNKLDPNNLKTAEIVRLLETADIAGVSTYHNQTVCIELKDGKEYRGIYVQKKAGKYAKIQECRYFMGLAKYIFKERRKTQKLGKVIFSLE
jgi:hypothetical protein